MKKFLLACAAVAPFATAVLAAVQEAHGGGIGYFQERCVRCHGNYGLHYDLDHLAKFPPAKLRETVTAMCENQGDSPLTGQELDAQIAYHRSLTDARPYIFVIGAQQVGDKTKLRGEATPESNVCIKIDEISYPATLEEHTFVATIPFASDWKKAKISATLNGQITEITAGDWFSHR